MIAVLVGCSWDGYCFEEALEFSDVYATGRGSIGCAKADFEVSEGWKRRVEEIFVCAKGTFDARGAS